MAPDTRAGRETCHNATEPASSAGSHDTIGHTTNSFGPPRDITIESIWSDISNISYISPANVGFDPTDPNVPFVRPMAPTPGISTLLPSSHAPSSCDFGTPKKFSNTPVFGPSPPFVPKTRDRSAFQARCETASPSDNSLSRFFRGFSSASYAKPAPRPTVRRSTPEACDGGASTTNPPTTYSPTPERLTTKKRPAAGTHTTNGPATDKPTMDASVTKNTVGAKRLSTGSRSLRSHNSASPSLGCSTTPSTGAYSAIANEPTAELPTIDLPTIDLSAPCSYSPSARPTCVGAGSIKTVDIGATDINPAAVTSSTEEANVDAFTNWSLYAIPGNVLADFVTGVLKFSQLDQDGNPVFVKECEPSTSPSQTSNSHNDLNAVHITNDEAQILVSMDQLRKEIAMLQEHDEAMEREADKAHQEKARLELQLQQVRGTSRKGSEDSAIGSDSESDIRKRAQTDKLNRMQKRLDEANALANSQDLHINALTAERDELIKECHLAYEHKKVLGEQNKALKCEVDQAAHYFSNIEDEYTRLKGDNDRLMQQVTLLLQQNDALRKTRRSHSDQIKNLHTELEATRGRLGDTIKDTNILRNQNRENQAHSEQMEQLRAELETTRGQLSTTVKDNQVLRNKNKHMQTKSEQVEMLKTELETTRGQLGEAIKDTHVLLRKNKEIKAQRDDVEHSYESLQENYTVIRRKLRDDTTVNSVSSSRSDPRPRRPAPAQVKRTTAPTAPTKSTVRTMPASAPDNDDYTIRPAYDPVENMRILISDTESEIARLQEQLEAKASESEGLHKGYRRRVWERLHEEKVALDAQIHEKNKILYHQYDLLEDLRRQGRV